MVVGTRTMRALVYEGPERLALREVPVPEPRPGEALVRVGYVGICGSDLHLWAGEIAGDNPPHVLGHEVVGEIAALPPEGEARGFRVGQRVALEPTVVCGRCRACREGNEHACRELVVLGVHAEGGAAEYMRAPLDRLHAVPEGLAPELAALTEPVAVAVHMIDRAGVRLGDTVLVIGGGPIGYLCAVVARAAGATRVVVSEPSEPRRAFCARAGFDTVDPRSEDPVAVLRGLTDGEGADVVVEVAGHPSAADVMIQAARNRGSVLIGGVHGVAPPVNLRAISVKELHVIGSRVYTSRDVDTALALLASGRLDVAALITSIVPLEEAITRGFEPLRRQPSEMKILIRP